MPYTKPTPAQLKARYPEFASVPDPTVQMFLDEAGSYVDDTWIERDYQPAYLAATAHLLAKGGYPRTGSVSIPLLGVGVKRRKVGDVETEYNVASSGGSVGSAGWWMSTPYGGSYYRLARMSIGGGVRLI